MNMGYNRYRSKRVPFLVMYCTAVEFTGCLKELTGPSVNAHDFTPVSGDKTHVEAGYRAPRICNRVEKEQALYTGVRTWTKPINVYFCLLINFHFLSESVAFI